MVQHGTQPDFLGQVEQPRLTLKLPLTLMNCTQNWKKKLALEQVHSIHVSGCVYVCEREIVRV